MSARSSFSLSDGFALPKTVQEHASNLFAILVGFLVGCVALGASEAIAQTIKALERQTNGESSGPGNAGLGDQSAAERYLGHQLPRDRAPAKRAGDERTDFRALLAITDVPVAGGGEQEGHANLVHG